MTQSPPVRAAEPEPAFSMQVTPTRLVVPPGTSEHRFDVTNKGSEPFQVTLEKSDFVTVESGAMRFQPGAPYAAAAWAEVTPARLTVPPGETRPVTLKVVVPENPEPGDHQFAVIFKVPAEKSSANIRINRGIAAPVFVTVPGAIDNSAEIADLRAPGFVMSGPVPITTRVRSTGTVHRDFRGLTRLKVAAGGSELMFPDFTVVRGAAREVTVTWEPPFVCYCDVTVALPGGNARTVQVVVFPLHLFVVLVALVMGGFLVGIVVRHRYRRRVESAARELAGSGVHA
ncbi:COG1361 family protein [Herbidospora sp. RD11066]